MTVESTTNKAQYQGNGSAMVFPIPFPFFKAADITVIRTDPGGVDTTLTGGYQVQAVPGGGYNVVYPYPEGSGAALPEGWTLTVLREVELTQPIKIENGDDYNADVAMEGYDRATMQIQQLAEQVSRAFTVGVTSEANPEEFLTQLLTAVANAENAAEAAETAAERAEAAVTQPVTATEQGLMPAYGSTPGTYQYVGLDEDEAPVIVQGAQASRPATQSEVTDGVVDPDKPALEVPFVGVAEHWKAHEITQHLFLESGTFIPTDDGVISLLVVDGGGRGGNGGAEGAAGTSGAGFNPGAGGSATSGTSGRGGSGGGGGLGNFRFAKSIQVKKGTEYPIIVGGPAGVSSFAGLAANGVSVDNSTYTRPMLISGDKILFASYGGSAGVTSQSSGSITKGGNGSYPLTLLDVSAFASDAPAAIGGSAMNYVGGGGGGAGGWTISGFGYPTANTGGSSDQSSGGGAGGQGFGAGGGGGAGGKSYGGTGGLGAQGCVFILFTKRPGGTE